MNAIWTGLAPWIFDQPPIVAIVEHGGADAQQRDGERPRRLRPGLVAVGVLDDHAIVGHVGQHTISRAGSVTRAWWNR